MYSREVEGTVRTFEASGSLYQSALVMQDDRSGSYWATVTAEAIGGPEQGRNLEELPISEKTTWGEWRRRHPDTIVLSVDGREDADQNPYESYLSSSSTYHGLKATDRRLPDKEPVFGVEIRGRWFAFPHRLLEGGRAWEIDGAAFFFYRPPGASVYRSTRAYRAEIAGAEVPIRRTGSGWEAEGLGSFDPETGRFTSSRAELAPVHGLDTFWLVWSRYHPESGLPIAPGNGGASR